MLDRATTGAAQRRRPPKCGIKASSPCWHSRWPMACSPLSCWLHSPKPVRCRLPTQVATSRFPRTSAGSPYGLPRQSRLPSYFPVGKLGSLDSHRAFPSTTSKGRLRRPFFLRRHVAALPAEVGARHSRVCLGHFFRDRTRSDAES